MNGSTLLKLLAQTATSDEQLDVLPSDIVRFSLIFHAYPDLQVVSRKLAEILDSRAFSLTRLEEDPSVEASRVLILQFPGSSRTLSERALFEMGQYLVDELQLRSAEPDLATRFFPEPDPSGPRIVGPESAIVGLWCSASAAPPTEHDWALRSVRAREAWAISPARGKGIFVGQPDTGVADHLELRGGMLDLAKGRNLLEGGAPTDPLAASMSHPGHGTATSSVVASREAGGVTGAAPKATLVPIRCVNSVILLDATPVAAAVNHARVVGCDVVTMSLGGLFSTPLQAAINDAISAGMIVLAAAGNCVGWVTYPASEARVIAVAGVNVNDKPWVGTSKGNLVDISAPAEHVYAALRKPGDPAINKFNAREGTSFAVATTAGVAALWLAHHGRKAVRAEAARRGTTVQTLFRTALRQTARRPASWDQARMGAGIVDAAALLSLSLRDIAAPSVASVAKPRAVVEKVSTLAAEGRTVGGFDWARHGVEANLLAAKAITTSRRALAGFESVGRGNLAPSSRLRATAPAVLRDLFAEAEVQLPSRARIRTNQSLEPVIRLLATAGAGLESAAGMTMERGLQRLREGHGRTLIGDLERRFRETEVSDEAAADRRTAVEKAETGLRKLELKGPAARLTNDEIFAVEALVSLHNRPAVRVTGDGFDPMDPMLGDWSATLFNSTELSERIAAVGRVNLDDVHVGTGWVIGPGLIATNRHVLEFIAEEFRLASGATTWHFSGDATVNFDPSGRGEDKRFRITGVVASGEDRINEIVDFAHLDLAVLAVESINAGGKPLPKPVKRSSDATLAGKGTDILICGYPARPDPNSLRDPETRLVRADVVSRLQGIFGLAYSVKYLSPGQITAAPGKLDGDAKAWVFGHDATTLGGSSGSLCLFLGDPLEAVGLHFGGGTLRSNYAHALSDPRAGKLFGS